MVPFLALTSWKSYISKRSQYSDDCKWLLNYIYVPGEQFMSQDYVSHWCSAKIALETISVKRCHTCMCYNQPLAYNIRNPVISQEKQTAIPALERFGKIVLSRISSWKFWKGRSFQTFPEWERRCVSPGLYSKWKKDDDSDNNHDRSLSDVSDEWGGGDQDRTVVVRRQNSQDSFHQFVTDFGGRDLVPAMDGGNHSVNVLMFPKEAPVCLNFGKSKNVFTTSPEEKENTAPLSFVQKIRERTVQHINKHTPHIWKTEGVTRVLQRISMSPSLLILTGRRGDGKTSTGYKVLYDLRDQGREVFYAVNPEEFDQICISSRKAVIMIENICGEYIFDYSMWGVWQPVLCHCLSLPDDGPTVLLVTNNFVLKQWSHRFDSLPVGVSIIDLTKDRERTDQEKLGILKALEKRYNVTLNETTRKFICEQDIHYGFPELCKQYLDDFGPYESVEQAFQLPSRLDKHTVKLFLQNTAIRKILSRMLEHNGELNISEEPDNDIRFTISATAKDFEGIFLYRKGNTYRFCDNYMYDLLASTMWDIDKRFVIENCPLTFINRSLRLTNEKVSQMSSRFLLLLQEDEEYLLKRFILEISRGNLLLVLSHEVCTSADFASRFMQALLEEYSSMERIICMTDKTHNSSFVFLSTSNKSSEILKIVLHGLTAVTPPIVSDIVFGICDSASSEALDHLTDLGYVLNLNMQNDLKQTPVMLAANTRIEDFMMKVLTLDIDANISDSLGRTLLHYLCENGLVRSAETVLETFKDINLKDNDGRTALQSACEEKHLPVVKLLTEKDATIDTNSLHEACKSGDLDIVKLLVEKGGDINTLSETGDTLLHSACEGSISVVDFLLEQGLDLNKTGYKGRTPLEKARMLRNSGIEKHLKARGAREIG